MKYEEMIQAQLHSLANELLQEQNGNKRAAFIAALDARDKSDFRVNSKPWKHYNAIVKWMIVNWPELG